MMFLLLLVLKQLPDQSIQMVLQLCLLLLCLLLLLLPLLVEPPLVLQLVLKQPPD